MISIQVTSRSAVRRDFITAICTFYAQELGIFDSDGRVAILSEKKVTSEFGHNGSVFMNQDDGVVYMLINSNLTMEKLMLTLAHEMVHVKQYLLGELHQVIDGDDVTNIWHGHVVPEMQYFDRPWEIEAMREEKYLSTRVWAKISAFQQP